MSDQWRPLRPVPSDLTWPVRIDPRGLGGPTRRQAQGPRWRRCGPGWYVPSDVPADRVEQRILEVGAQLREYEALTGWSALRWHGGGFFDAQSLPGCWRPIPVIRRSGARPDPHRQVDHHRQQLAPYDAVTVGGVQCTTVERALFDEMRWAPSVREAVVAMDMTAAARLISVSLMADYVERRPAWAGVRKVRAALDLAVDGSRSPQESRLRLVWVLDAALPEPLCNVPVFDRDGNLLGVPDLLDPRVGLVAEYDGAHHKQRARHRRDVAREHRFREHGLEYVAVVGGDLSDRALVVDRLVAAHRRASPLGQSPRAWTVEPPPWWSAPAA